MRLCGIYSVAALIRLYLIASAADIVDRLPRPVTETAPGSDGERVVADWYLGQHHDVLVVGR